uniref:Uncharacterized protein n=1 Tax=Caenorhabditis japonica TaxID=281687 RepID=A0A8R1HT10_CAEJA
MFFFCLLNFDVSVKKQQIQSNLRKPDTKHRCCLACGQREEIVKVCGAASDYVCGKKVIGEEEEEELGWKRNETKVTTREKKEEQKEEKE